MSLGCSTLAVCTTVSVLVGGAATIPYAVEGTAKAPDALWNPKSMKFTLIFT
ncbi:hypothetical protein C8R44DRAFT_976333 [Mycena epipterygia]|nr:hypothetical protein C8R44DRAFT_976333 [Mycena epipterygia]